MKSYLITNKYELLDFLKSNTQVYNKYDIGILTRNYKSESITLI